MNPGPKGQSDLILVGKIRGCFGLHGYLKLELAGRSPEQAKKLRRVFIGPDENGAEPRTVEDVNVMGGKVMVKLESAGDRTAAERYAGSLLFVAQEDAVAPPEGSWFIHDVLGCEVRTEKDEFVGTVADVLDVSGQHIWVVKNADAEYSIPAVKEFVTLVDIRARKIIIRAPEGLLEM